jgi:O-antigen/teichoic acid export membrane protein
MRGRARCTGGISERASFSRGAGFGVLSFGLILLISLVTQVVVARVYGVRVIGEFALAFAPTGAVWILSTVREQAALVRELAKLPPHAPRSTALFLAVLCFSFLLTLAVAAIAVPIIWVVFHGPIYEPQLFGPAIVSLAGYVTVTNTCWNLDSMFAAYRAGRDLFWVRLDQALSYLALAVGAGLITTSVWGLILATIASWAIALAHRLLLASRWIRWRVPRAELRAGFRALPGLLRFGLKATPGALSDGVTQESPTWILGNLTSVVAVGAYSRAWTLGLRLTELNYRVGEMLLPTLAERRAKGDREGFDRALVDTVRYAAMVMLLPAAVGAGSRHAVMWLFGPGFGQAADALAFILLIPVLFTMSSSQNMALLALDRPWRSTAISALRMAVVVGASIALTHAIGITGAAIGAAIGYSLEFLLQVQSTRRHLQSPLHVLWPARQILGLLVAYPAGFLAAALVEGSGHDLARLPLALTSGAIAYVVVLIGVGGLLERDRRRLDHVFRSLASARRTAGGAPGRSTLADP